MDGVFSQKSSCEAPVLGLQWDLMFSAKDTDAQAVLTDLLVFVQPTSTFVILLMSLLCLWLAL